MIEAPDDKASTQARCGHCDQLLLIRHGEVAKTTGVDGCGARTAVSDGGAGGRRVNYLHHTRDRDGDVIFYFSDPLNFGDAAVLTSSPVTGMRRVLSGVVDAQGGG